MEKECVKQKHSKPDHIIAKVPLPGLPIGEAVRRRLESEASAPVGEVGQSSRRAGAVLLRPDLLVGDWTTLPACCF